MSEDELVKWRQEFSKLNSKKIVSKLFIPINIILTGYVFYSSGENIFWSLLVAFGGTWSLLLCVIGVDVYSDSLWIFS